jgi:hypothetical protein
MSDVCHLHVIERVNVPAVPFHFIIKVSDGDI